MALLAGCSAPEAGQVDSRAAAAALTWPTLSVTTTPLEPLEATGAIRAAWSGPLFALAADAEPQLRRRMVVEDGTAYVNQIEGMGWTRFGLLERAPANSPRLVLWDLPRLLADPGTRIVASPSGPQLNLTASGEAETVRGRTTFEVQVGAVDGRVVWARLTTPVDPEAPFTFRFDGTPMPFQVRVPPASRTVAEASAGLGPAQSGHVQVIKLLQAYQRNHGCQVPDEPSPESLRLELLVAQASWPTNPYSGLPLAMGDRPGDFGWQKRGPTDATYVGWGWDGAVVSQTFGASCS